jgi:hypothetical protein
MILAPLYIAYVLFKGLWRQPRPRSKPLKVG